MSEPAMGSFNEILLDVWREACRHIEISECAAKIAKMLVRHMPLEELIVRRVDRARSCLETVAVGLAGAIDLEIGGRTECLPEELDKVMEWWARGEVTLRSHEDLDGRLPRTIVPEGCEGEVLAGPLGSSELGAGLLIAVASPQSRFDARHAAMVRILLEPFAVALENDHRLNEIAALREAAEADKRSLLNRLGRTGLGDTIIGHDSGLRTVMERVRLVARSDVPVLILGETGSGKELVARVIHKQSPRSSGPIMRVNCGAIPPELIDSQLFGHEKGSFTGATERRKGWFERASGGTLFLDEIGELPLAAQVRLLRILQDGWLERVGGQQHINVDVRIIAATHQDLAAMVTQGRFREDLWYRIAVFPILLPPLRDRLEDIPALARHFAERAAIRFTLPVLMPTENDIKLLRSYPWPGNIRELGTVMDRAAIIGDGKRLEVAKALGVMDAKSAPVQEPREHSAVQQFGEERAVPAQPFLTLDEAMRNHIEAALARTKGRVEGPHGAAALLKINPHTLRARMRKLKVNWSQFRND